MGNADFIIVGAGIAGDAAVRGIRSVQPTASILVLGSEPDVPYSRPALSKALWRDADATVESIALETSTKGVELRTSTSVTSIDADAKTVTLHSGEEIGYGKLIVATGGTPRTLGGTVSDRVIPYRTLDDYRRVRELTETGKHLGVIGGGFIGTEMAAALIFGGATSSFIFSGALVGDTIFPPEIARHLDEVFRQRGVDLHPNARVESVVEESDGVAVHLVGGDVLHYDAVVLGLGITPNTDLLVDAGLSIDDRTKGIPVDEYLQTSDPSIYAAGDVATYHDPVFGLRRVEHEDAANTQGEVAGRNAAGADDAYEHTPFFYSDLFDDGYEAVGNLSAKLHTVIDWKNPGKEAVVYYLDDADVLQGVLLWNVWGDDDHDTKELARRLLAKRTPTASGELLGAI